MDPRAATARVDAGPAIGLGHLKRCVTLLKRLRTEGYTVRLVARERPPTDIAEFTAGIPLEFLADTLGPVRDEAADADATLAVLRQQPGSWVVLDHYGLGESWERRVRDAGHPLVVLDDYRNRRHCADVLVSDGAAPFDPRLLDGGARPRVLTGPAYALIDDDFAPRRTERTRPATLLISYGGADPTGETAKAITALRELQREGRSAFERIDIVIGPLNHARPGLESQAREVAGARVHAGPPSLAPLMRDADVVMTAGGNSVAEALAMRKVCLVTVVADNQRPMVDELQAAGVVTSLGDHSGVSAADLVKALRHAVEGFGALARRVSEQSVIDHHGATRIVKAMQETRL